MGRYRPLQIAQQDTGAAALPAGKMQYHGMTEAAAASGVVLEGRTAFRNVVGNLGRDELVFAVARGGWTPKRASWR